MSLPLQAKLLTAIFSFFFFPIAPVRHLHQAGSVASWEGAVLPWARWIHRTRHTFKEYLQTENAQIKLLLSIATSHSTHIPPVILTGSDKIKSLLTVW